METWKETEGAKYGIAIYNFDGNVTHGLSLDIGDAVQIFEGCAGWYRGCCLKTKAVKGIFPASFVQLKECIVENLGTPLEVIIPSGDSVVKEVTAVLREWFELWKDLFLTNNEAKFLEMKKMMNHLIGLRQKILSGALTQELITELKGEMTSKIDFWNSQMELDLVPRINGEAADVDQTSVVELYNIHVHSLKESQKLEREASIAMPTSRMSVTRGHRHILLSIKRFVCNVEECFEVFFSLFDGEAGKFLSERFLVRLNKGTLPEVAETLGAVKTKTLFTDLGRKTVATELFIVCCVVRTGQMHSEQSPKKKLSVNFRRPFACGVFNVQENILFDDDYFGEDQTFSFPLYQCNNDADFHNMHEIIIRKLSSKYPMSSSADGMSMDVSLKIFNGDREKVIKANPLWMPPDIYITRKLGFPEIILPGDIRNDVFITLDRGEFEKGGKSSGKNIEVCVSVLTSNGTVLQNCVHAGTGCQGTNEYQSLIFYHNNFPKWNETVKLNIPTDKFQDCHVLFVFKHCPTMSNMREKPGKIFAFAFLKPLSSDGTTIVNGNHQLVLYKTSLLDSKNPGKYLGYPSSVAALACADNQHGTNNSWRNAKDTFFVTTLTCSTKLTQNLDLVGLLRWRQQKTKMPDVLASLVKVRGDEIVKFLQDILDALFSILNEDTENSGMLVFQDLIFIINLLLDSKYQQFQSVLNTYIKYHFSAALAHRHIVSLFNKVMLENKGKDGSSVVTVAKALQFVIKLVMQSWALYIRTHPEQSNFEFKQSVRELFVRLNEVMERTGDSWRGAQISILLSLPKVYVDLSAVFMDDELAYIVKDLFCSARSSSLAVDKLNFLDGIITTSPLFYNASSRVTLMPLLLNCLHEQLLQKNELKTCADLLGNLLSCLSKTTSGSVYDEVDQISKSLLQVVFQAVVTVDRSSSRAGLYVAILFALLKMMSEDHYQRYLKSFSNQKDLRDFLNKAFGVFTNLLRRNIYPDDWFVMKIEGNYAILVAVQNFSQALTDSFLHEDAFDYKLWSTYFHLAISFVSHEILNLDKYSEAKRMKILEKYGDMRHVMGFEIVRMWNSLGDLQSQFVPSMIAPFLEMTLVPEPVLRRETLPIFYDMMDREMSVNGNIEKIEEEFIDKLDVYLSKDGMGDENYKELFEEILTEKISKNSSLKEPGLLFVNSVTQLLERLLDYRKVLSSREEYRDMKMSCIVNLLNYYEEIGKQDMYLRYIERLYSLHLSAENYIEAGFAIYLYASRLEYTDIKLRAEETFPAQTESERKEMLYKKAIEHLDKGKLWESGIRLCKTLVNLYETVIFDFIKLSGILRTQAQFFKNIIETYRPEPVYFKVGFFGKAFPVFLQNKQFVYRGNPLEKISGFCFRIQNEYPDAEVLRHNNPLEEEIMQSHKQYIQCCQVEPVSDNQTIPNNIIASSRISSYYDVNWVSKFNFSRPFHKGQIEDKSNEFATLWCEVTTLTIETWLPGLLPWFPVVASESIVLSPIENALNTVTSKTRDLNCMVNELQDDVSASINPLSMILNGVIDAAVNGGIANYRKAFFIPEYTRTNPQRMNEVSRLEDALLVQAGVLRFALILHESKISENLRPLHENLLNRYNYMVNDLPGETSGLFLIQEKKRKDSLPNTPIASDSTPSLDKRTSFYADTGTLPRKISQFKGWLTGRKSSFDQESESNRQSTSSDGMRQSSSLMSITEPTIGVSQSVSVPDLRIVDESRPKLPQKLRATKLFPEDGGSPSSPARSRVSIASSSASVSVASLTEIDEIGETELVEQLARAVDGAQNSNSLTVGRSVIDRSPSPAKMKSSMFQNSLTPPAVPPKKRASISLQAKKRQSNFFEMSSNGSYRVSKAPLMKQSKSMDDLDKIGEEASFPNQNRSTLLKGVRSEENLLSGMPVVNDRTLKAMNTNGNDAIPDEEIPPPLKPRKPKSVAHSEEPYDTLSPNSFPWRYRRLSPREIVYDSQSAAQLHSSDSTKEALELNAKMKHYYANLVGSTPLQRQNKYTSTDSQADDVYDTLAMPTRLSSSTMLGNTPRQSSSISNETVYDSLNIPRLDSSSTTNIGLEVARPNSSTTYDTVVLRDSKFTADHDRNGTVSLSLHSQKPHYETVTKRDFIPGAGKQPPVNNLSDAYDFLVEPNPTTKSNDCMSNITSIHPKTTDRNANESNAFFSKPPPVLPPKTFRKDAIETPTKQHSSTMLSNSASLSKDTKRTSSTESSPTTGRKKPAVLPKPALLPKPRKFV